MNTGIEYPGGEEGVDPRATIWAVLKAWLEDDPVGQGILRLISTEPTAAAAALAERLRNVSVPPALATYVLGGEVNKIVNIAQVFGDVHSESPRRRAQIPRELPADLQEFVGRDRQVAQLLRQVSDLIEEGKQAKLVLYGMGGVGKSTLAIHVAHLLADRFPDGQVYVDLRGTGIGPRAVESIDALARILNSLGEDGNSLPSDIDAAAALFRSQTRDKRFILVLDNAATVEQVTHLMPSAPESAVVVTSRRPLVALQSASHNAIEPFNDSEAIELIAKLFGRTLDEAEVVTAGRIAELCGNLPLALRLAAARTRRYSVRALEQVYQSLATPRRLDELQEGPIGVRTTLHGSYKELDESIDPADQRAARILRYLAELDVSDIAMVTVAQLVDEALEDTSLSVGRLVDAALITNKAFNRYALHDLVRLFGREQAQTAESASTRDAALVRIVNFYTAICRRISYTLQPADDHRGSRTPTDGTLELDSEREALSWLDVEIDNMVSLTRQATKSSDVVAGRAVALAIAAYWGLRIHGKLREWKQIAESGLAAARRLNDRVNEAYLLGDLADAIRRLGEVDEARSNAQSAIAIFEELKYSPGLARTYNLLGNIYTQHGNWDDGNRCYRHAHDLFVELENRPGQMNALGNLSLVAAELGEYDGAYEYLIQVLAMQREVGDLHNESTVLVNLAELSLKRADATIALFYCNQALEIADKIGDPNIEAITLNLRGEAYRQVGSADIAVREQNRALRLAQETGQLYTVAEAYWRLGLALRDLDQPRQAVLCWRIAHSTFSGIGAPETTIIEELLADSDGI